MTILAEKMSSEGGDPSVLVPAETTAAQEVSKGSRIRYTRAFLVSLAKTSAEKGLPRGIEPSVLSELDDFQLDHSWKSSYDSDSESCHEHQHKGLLSPENIGLLGPGSLKGVHGGITDASPPKVEENILPLLHKSKEPNRPPHLLKESCEIMKELEAQLREAGNQLLAPPAAVDDLLALLERIESCLSKVKHSPNKSMQAALLPSQKALVAEQLFGHSDPDVKVSVASCISELTRITAPGAPYDDDQIKVFQLIVSSFENLDDKSSRSYTKRASILKTVAKVKSCMDLECPALIVNMFQHFLKAIRDYHPADVFSSMETIMTLVIEESEDISSELLSPLLDSVKSDDEDILPISRKLGERVIKNSALKLKPRLKHELETHGIALGDYSKVVASICQEAAGDTEQHKVHDDKDMEDKSTFRESSDEAVQVDEENSTAAVSPEQVDPVIDGVTKVVMNDGGAATGEDECSADLNSSKKEEQVEDIVVAKCANTSSVHQPDTVETDEAVDAKQMPEEVSKDKDKVSAAQPADNPQADNLEETEALSGQKSLSEYALDPPCEDRDVEGVVHPENEKGSDNTSSALENESTDFSPPSPSWILPGESRLKKAGRHVAEDDSKRAVDRTSDLELKSSKCSGKKVSAGVSNENKSPIVVDAPGKESGRASDSEVKPKSSEKVSAGNSKDNKTSVVIDAPGKESGGTSNSEARHKSARKGVRRGTTILSSVWQNTIYITADGRIDLDGKVCRSVVVKIRNISSNFVVTLAGDADVAEDMYKAVLEEVQFNQDTRAVIKRLVRLKYEWEQKEENDGEDFPSTLGLHVLGETAKVTFVGEDELNELQGDGVLGEGVGFEIARGALAEFMNSNFPNKVKERIDLMIGSLVRAAMVHQGTGGYHRGVVISADGVKVVTRAIHTIKFIANHYQMFDEELQCTLICKSTRLMYNKANEKRVLKFLKEQLDGVFSVIVLGIEGSTIIRLVHLEKKKDAKNAISRHGPRRRRGKYSGAWLNMRIKEKIYKLELLPPTEPVFKQLSNRFIPANQAY